MKKLSDALKRHLDTKPLFTACSVYLASLLVFAITDPISGIFFKVSAAGLLLFGALSLGKFKKEIALCLIFPLAISMISAYFSYSVPSETAKALNGKNCEIRFTTDKIIYSRDYGSAAEISITSIDGKECSVKAEYHVNALLTNEGSYSDTAVLELYSGDGDTASSRFSRISDGIYVYAGSLTEMPVFISPPDGVFSYAAHINSFLSERLREYIPGEEGRLTDAMLLGNKASLERVSVRNFSNVGLSHVLALSGMHLSVLTFVLEKLLRKAGAGKKTRIAVISSFLAVYVLITGASSSVLRSSVMLALYYLSFLLSRRSDDLTTLLFSVTLICIISPGSVLDIGLILSFLSTLGILSLGVPASDKLKAFYKEHIKKRNLIVRAVSSFVSALVESLLFTLSAVAYSILPVFVFFGEVSYLAPIGNLIVSPLAALLLLTSFLLLPLSLFPFIPEAFAAIPYYTAKAMLSFSASLSDKCRLVSLNYPFVPFLIGCMILALFVLRFFSVKKLRGYFAVILSAILLFAAGAAIMNALYKTESELTVLKNGKRDVYFRAENRAFAILGGRVSSSEKQDIYNAEKCGALVKTDGIVVIEPSDAVSSSLRSMACSRFIDKIWYPYPAPSDLRNTCDKCGTHLIEFTPGDKIELSGISTVGTYPEYSGTLFRYDVTIREKTFSLMNGKAFKDKESFGVICSGLSGSDVVFIASAKDWMRSDLFTSGTDVFVENGGFINRITANNTETDTEKAYYPLKIALY